MTRIVICGGPRTGKTTRALSLGGSAGVLKHTDDLIEQVRHLGKDGWSEASRIASTWLDEPGPWIVEGVAMSRALRKWRDAHPGEPPPVDRVIRMTAPVVECTAGQIAMAKGEARVWSEIEDWLEPVVGMVTVAGRLVTFDDWLRSSDEPSTEHQVRSSTDG